MLLIGGASAIIFFFFFQAEDGIRDWSVTGVQTCALPICASGGDLRGGQERLPAVVHPSLADPEEDARIAIPPVDEVVAAVSGSLPVRPPEAVVTLPTDGRFVEVAFLTLGDRGPPEPAVGGLGDVVDQLVVAQVAQGVIAGPVLLVRVEHLDAGCGGNRVSADGLLVDPGEIRRGRCRRRLGFGHGGTIEIGGGLGWPNGLDGNRGSGAATSSRPRFSLRRGSGLRGGFDTRTTVPRSGRRCDWRRGDRCRHRGLRASHHLYDLVAGRLG